jgi:phosphoglycolate phosphatase
VIVGQKSGTTRKARSYRLIAFDLDGTLVDSRRDIANAANELLVQCGGAPLPEARIGRMVGDGAATLVARAFEASRIERPADALPQFLAIYDRHLTDHTRPYDGIAGALTALGARAVLAVLTNKPLAATRTILDRLGLARHFAPGMVFGGDGPFPRKPDPAALGELIRLAHAETATTLLVGDSVIDWRTARAARASVCLARYGFGFEDLPPESIGPDDLVIDTPAELVGALGFDS